MCQKKWNGVAWAAAVKSGVGAVRPDGNVGIRLFLLRLCVLLRVAPVD
jgi:hypothetical protein